MSGAATVLEAHGLSRRFTVGGGLFGAGGGDIHALEDIDLTLRAGETLAVVGESGCGKSTLARLLALLDRPSAGSVHVDGRRADTAARRDLKALRRRVQIVFQDPYASLNPRMTARSAIAEPLVIHRLGNRTERRLRTRELAEAVGLDAETLDRYPHQFSGGQRQRIALARALAPDPAVVVADEPTSALDVSVQSQVLNLLQDLQQRLGVAYVLISHDLAVVEHMADRVAVMYLGRVVEHAERERLFADPRHPYTRALMAAAPRLGTAKRQPGHAPRGEPPSPVAPPPGCPFHPRCPIAEPLCRDSRPGLDPVAGADGHRAACHFRDDARRQEQATP